MTQPIRGERAGVEFGDATWTSFDRYSRYGGIARALRATLGPGSHRVLDIGDSAGYLRTFDADLQVTAIDLSLTDAPLGGTPRVQGNGTCLPFADQTFDAVVSSDVLEHVPGELRAGFLAELHRVTRDLVIVAAPFDTPGVAGVEELVRRYALLATSTPQEQLDEHRDNILPDLDVTAAVLREHFGDVTVQGNGNLQDWLSMMLLKHQLMGRPALVALLDGSDLLYNLLLAGRVSQGPYYRYLVAARRSGIVELGELEPLSDGIDPAAVLDAVLGANLTEVVRQDTVPLLNLLVEKAIAHEQQLGEARATQAEISDRLAAIGEAVQQMQTLLHRLTRPLHLLRHPLARGDRQPGGE